MNQSVKIRRAVSRILAGETTYQVEAQATGKSVRQLKRYVAAAKKAGGLPADGTEISAESGTAPVVTPLDGVASTAPNPALDAARKGAGLGGGPSGAAPLTPDEVRAGVVDMEKFCVETIATFKGAIGGAVVTLQYSPPLDLGDPAVQKYMALSPMADMAIRANAAKLYPMLMKAASGTFQVFAALALDGIFMLVGLRGLATKKGWTPKRKPSGPRGGSESPEAGPAPQPEEAPAPGSVFDDIKRARENGATKKRTFPGQENLEEALKPGSGDVAPGTFIGAPIIGQ